MRRVAHMKTGDGQWNPKSGIRYMRGDRTFESWSL